MTTTMDADDGDEDGAGDAHLAPRGACPMRQQTPTPRCDGDGGDDDDDGYVLVMVMAIVMR